MPLFIAFLYQSTLMCGIEGGFRLKEPEMEKCGNLMCGRLQLKLKIPFSLFTMPCTKDHTPLNTLVKVDLIPFRILLTVDFTAFKPEEIPLFLKAAEGDSAEIEMLLELHSLRISEALYVVRHDMIDLKHNVINVRGAIVQDKDNKFVEKGTTKTSASARTIPIMIPRLADLLKEYQNSGKPIPIHAENTILSHVHKTCARAGVTDVTNHGLRRTFASLGYSLGLSELSMQQMGGWDDPGTMHKIYIKLAARDKKRAENAMTNFYRDKSSDARLADALSKLSDLLKEYADLSPLEPLRQQLSAIENANKNAN